MRLTALVVASAFGAAAATASAGDPCAPPPTRPVHVAAFATQETAPRFAASGAPSSSAPSAEELAIQAGCLAWESAHARRAEVIGTVPLETAAPSGAFVTTGTTVSVLRAPGPSLPFLSTPPGAFPPASRGVAEGPRAFSLGVSLAGPR